MGLGNEAVILIIGCLKLLGKMSYPNKKKPRVEKDKRSKGEKAMDRAIDGFVKFQNEADKKYQKWEERWKKQRITTLVRNGCSPHYNNYDHQDCHKNECCIYIELFPVLH